MGVDKMLKKEVPETFVSWVSYWFSNSIARVRVQDFNSRARVMREGVPQRTVLSPLPFITLLDDLLHGFAPNTLVTAYADDMALAVSGNPRVELERRMQGEVDNVVSCSN